MKNLFQKIKLIVSNISETLFYLIILYGVLALMKWDINIAHWQKTRAFFVLIAIILVGATIHCIREGITEINWKDYKKANKLKEKQK